MAQSSNLDIYAKAEHLFELDEPTLQLHDLFLETLQRYEPSSLLDIGCGRGLFMSRAQELGIECRGIDVSSIMVDDAQSAGFRVEQVPLEMVEGKFDAIVAIFDVLNFIEPTALGEFLDSVALRLNHDGIFIADINTKYGFEAVADGLICVEDEKMFVSMESIYEDETLTTIFKLFEHSGDGCYRRESAVVKQYYYTKRLLSGFDSLKLVGQSKISLYDKNDKLLLIFQKA